MASSPPHVTAYLTMALCLFPNDDYEEVATKVTGALSRFGCWDANWSVPTSSGITQARKRLGRRVMPEVFEDVVTPVATSDTRGAWLHGWRLLAIDGFDVDLPDTPSAAEAADLDPDRISYTRALRITRRCATGTAAISP